MVVTEEEAALKQCRATAAFIDNADAINYPMCVASKCMAWRIDETRSDGAGYCGLAGKPGRQP